MIIVLLRCGITVLQAKLLHVTQIDLESALIHSLNGNVPIITYLLLLSYSILPVTCCLTVIRDWNIALSEPIISVFCLTHRVVYNTLAMQ